MSVTKKAEKMTKMSVEYIGNGIWIAAKGWSNPSNSVYYAIGRDAAEIGLFSCSPFQACHPNLACEMRDWMRSQGWL